MLQGVAAFDGVAEGLVPDIVAADAGYLVAAARRFPHARVVAVNLRPVIEKLSHALSSDTRMSQAQRFIDKNAAGKFREIMFAMCGK